MVDFSKFQFQGEDGRDEFDREPIAEKIIQLLTSNIDISPMIIDGDWGTGKSEFCHKLINKFKKNKVNYQIIYVDAFKADHADNPLMTIFAEIIKIVPPDKKEGFIKKALPVIRYGAMAVLKAGVSYIMRKNADDIADELEGTIQDTANSAIDATMTRLLKDHEEAEKNLEALQTLLAELAKEKPIVIFIDELDRCRPDFSVSMLEVIKHTFDVENVKFVLVTNTVQLKAAINHAYGSTVNAQRYLDKFIKFTIALPDKFNLYAMKPSTASIKFFQEQVKNSKILQQDFLINGGDETQRFIHRLIEVNSLSLREVEAFVRYIEIADILGIKLDKKSEWASKVLCILGLFIACFKPQLAIDIQKNRVKVTDLLNLVQLPNTFQLQAADSDAVMIILASELDIESDQYKKMIAEYDASRSTSIKQIIFGPFSINSNYCSEEILRVIQSVNLITK